MSTLSWPDLKHAAWEAVERHALYDEHADGCDETESMRLYEEADNALDALWDCARQSVVCEKCGLEALMAKREAEALTDHIGQKTMEARERLVDAIEKGSPPHVVSPLIDALILTVRLGNAP